MDWPISITAELIVIGGASSNFTEFLRGLILRIEDYPRLARSWKYLPSFFGVCGILAFPSSVAVDSILVLLAHGAASPALYYVAYPLLEKLVGSRIKAAFGGEGATVTTKEGDR